MGTTRITRKIEIDAGHRIPDHGSRCRFVHGHRYCVEATLQGDLSTEGSDNGMVADFGFIKEVLMEEVHALFDHKLILWDRDPLLDTVVGVEGFDVVEIPVIPTAEGLAQYIFYRIAPRLDHPEGRYCVMEVIVRETPNSIAVYHR